MTLAAIVLLSILGIFWSGPAPSLGAAAVHQSAQTASSAGNSDTQNQGKVTKPQNPPADAKPPASGSAPAQAPSGQQQPPAKLPRHKKREASRCGTAPATGAPATPASDPAKTSSGGNAQGQDSGTTTPPRNCPPPKIVVRQGGTSEPSIQLAGKPVGDQAIQEQATANQMLGSTEENLKKIAGRQLNATEEDMVTQIRQFMEQSKSAVAAGDPERARTLAWKAQTLSEDLVNPKK